MQDNYEAIVCASLRFDASGFAQFLCLARRKAIRGTVYRTWNGCFTRDCELHGLRQFSGVALRPGGPSSNPPPEPSLWSARSRRMNHQPGVITCRLQFFSLNLDGSLRKG